MTQDKNWSSAGASSIYQDLIDTKRNSREDLYRFLPSNSIGAEIGVDTGENAVIINSLISPKKFYLIDPWDLCDVSSEKWNTKRAKKSTFDYFADKENVTIIQDYSTEASKKFENHYFDWIHIDTFPNYENVKKDLAHWLPKMKKGGYITGDEFNIQMPHWGGPYTALIEFVIKYVEKKPEMLDGIRQFREQYREYLEYAFHNIPHSTEKAGIKFNPQSRSEAVLSSENHLFSDFKITLKYEYDFQIKGSYDLIATVLKWIEYFPNQRHKGGSYALQIGDWVDDLNYDEIIKEVSTIQNNPIFHKVQPGLFPTLMRVHP